MRAVLWVSADGLRVVDDKTKVMSPSGRLSHLDQKERTVGVALAAVKVEAAELQQ